MNARQLGAYGYIDAGDSGATLTPIDNNMTLFGTGSPVGARQPDSINQLYIDTNTPNNYWLSTGLNNTNWKQIGSSDTLLSAVLNNGDLPANDYYYFPYYSSVESDFTFASLKTISGYFYVQGNSALATINLPNLVSTADYSYFLITTNSILTSVSVPLLASIGSDTDFYIFSNPLLTSLSFPSLVLTGNLYYFEFSANALDLASENAFLAKCVACASYVSGNIDISGGTNAALDATGLAYVATLTTRGVTVTYN